ncbi:MAG: hypothetical protein AAF497_21910, partial [Planctomycetota bacterium]
MASVDAGATFFVCWYLFVLAATVVGDWAVVIRVALLNQVLEVFRYGKPIRHVSFLLFVGNGKLIFSNDGSPSCLPSLRDFG